MGTKESLQTEQGNEFEQPIPTEQYNPDCSLLPQLCGIKVIIGRDNNNTEVTVYEDEDIPTFYHRALGRLKLRFHSKPSNLSREKNTSESPPPSPTPQQELPPGYFMVDRNHVRTPSGVIKNINKINF